MPLGLCCSQGFPPHKACRAVLKDIARRTAPGEGFRIGLVATNVKQGEVGPAATMELREGFCGETRPGPAAAVSVG
ncbi:N(4)-(Beta-N-acetylglucosaminyl)-L-asparaginase-like [Arapaima gigas]